MGLKEKRIGGANLCAFVAILLFANMGLKDIATLVLRHDSCRRNSTFREYGSESMLSKHQKHDRIAVAILLFANMGLKVLNDTVKKIPHSSVAILLFANMGLKGVRLSYIDRANGVAILLFANMGLKGVRLSYIDRANGVAILLFANMGLKVLNETSEKIPHSSVAILLFANMGLKDVFWIY